MTKGTLAWCAAVLLTGAGFYSACNDTITGEDCKVKCQDVDNTCIQKCNSDNTCKTACTTDLDNCTASCGTVMATPPDGGH